MGNFSSVNINNSNIERVFSDINNAISRSTIEETEKQRLSTLVSGLEDSYPKGNFSNKYKEFIQLAANHMGILAPFLPALSKLL